ncbi:hypothetical protein [Paenibacillus sp. KS-LC4]|uniref:hypothetical protein n=1 Tax=Paenibacillus sp. KS-LC4 TaxID=2979727 RepID=UPI0030CB9682
MYLSLCGAVELENQRYRAIFHPERYMPFLEGGQAGAIPLYIMIEALAQISCRASSTAFFGGARTIPVQIKNVRYVKQIFDSYPVGELVLSADVGQKGKFALADCKLETAEGEMIVEAAITVSPLPPQ